MLTNELTVVMTCRECGAPLKFRWRLSQDADGHELDIEVNTHRCWDAVPPADDVTSLGDDRNDDV